MSPKLELYMNFNLKSGELSFVLINFKPTFSFYKHMPNYVNSLTTNVSVI